MSGFAEKLSKMKAFRSRKPASVRQIEDAESELGIIFADEYREYLLTYGAASVFGHEFTGISSNSRISVIDVTIEERKLNNSCGNLYVTEQTNTDGIVIWQDSRGNVYKTQPGTVAKKICSSLSEYLMFSDIC